MSTNRRLSGRQALAVWPERLAAVRTEPSDEGLQRLCSLLDAIDRWVVERWNAPGHEDRMATLATYRAEAREANGLVSAALRETGRRRAEQTNRKRAVSRASDVARATRSLVPVQGTTDGPAAA